MNRMSKFAAWFFIIFALLFMLGVAVSIAHGSTTPAPRPNGLGVSETYSNPNTYLLAMPIDGQILDGRFTNIRFAPFATPDLYDETVLFCTDVTPLFAGKSGTVIVVYRTQASGKYRGVGCHELLGVYEVKANDVR